MGSGIWFKNIINKKKLKGADKSQKLLKRHSAPGNLNTACSEDHCPALAQTASSVDNTSSQIRSLEDAAATRIQTAYRAYLARKNFRRTKGTIRLQNLIQRNSVKKQSSTTLSYLNSWNKVQAQIRARRAHMVTEGRLRQKKLENQLKLEAKLHDLEVEWNSGSETFDEALARIHQREEAALKRERAMAYAFSHQWRANSNPRFGSGNGELGKTNWGWSWADRWVSAQPWESRVSVHESPKKTNGHNNPKKTSSKKSISISPTSKATPEKVKSASPNGKVLKGRKQSYEAAEKKGARRVSPLAEEKKSKNEKEGP